MVSADGYVINGHKSMVLHAATASQIVVSARTSGGQLWGAWFTTDASVELDSRERRQVVDVRTATRPTEAVLDPQLRVLDMDRSNNTKPL